MSEIDPLSGSDRFISLIDASALALSPTGSLYVGTGNSLYEVDALTGSDRFISSIDASALAVVPIPAAVWLFGSALGVMGVMRRKVAN